MADRNTFRLMLLILGLVFAFLYLPISVLGMQSPDCIELGSSPVMVLVVVGSKLSYFSSSSAARTVPVGVETASAVMSCELRLAVGDSWRVTLPGSGVVM